MKNASIKPILILACSILISGTQLHAQEKTTSGKTAKDFPKRASTVKFIEMIVGTWKLSEVVDGARNTDKPRDKNTSNNAMQMIEFERDGRYKLNSSTNALDSGSYRLNEEHGLLYLESDKDDISPSEWSIAFNKQLMTLTGRPTQGAPDSQTKRFKYIYKRTKEGLGTQTTSANKD